MLPLLGSIFFSKIQRLEQLWTDSLGCEALGGFFWLTFSFILLTFLGLSKIIVWDQN